MWSAEPDGVPRVAVGVEVRVDRLRCLGNAVVPQCAEWLGRCIMIDAGLAPDETEAADQADISGKHWPTARDAHDIQAKRTKDGSGGQKPPLCQEVKLLPTPRATEHKGGYNSKSGAPSLGAMATHGLWPTPTSLVGSMYLEKNAAERNSMGLGSAVHQDGPTDEAGPLAADGADQGGLFAAGDGGEDGRDPAAADLRGE
jgi:hypothetical protein